MAGGQLPRPRVRHDRSSLVLQLSFACAHAEAYVNTDAIDLDDDEDAMPEDEHQLTHIEAGASTDRMESVDAAFEGIDT